MSEAILKKGKSYLVEVETYGMGYRNMFLHMPDSDFSALEDEAHRLGKEDEWYEYLDDETRYDFSDDLKEGTLDEILFTCIGHDLNHPGIGNTYLVKSGHPYANCVNGKAPLENMHCYTLI